MKKLELITWLKSCSSITAISSFLATLLATPAFPGGGLLLFGGSDRTVFLGCFTCGKVDTSKAMSKPEKNLIQGQLLQVLAELTLPRQEEVLKFALSLYL